MDLTRRTLLTAALAGAAGSLAPLRVRAEAPLSVVATTGMIADAARQVAGDAAAVTALMAPGVDPHSFRQTRTDIARLSRADLVLWHGLNLEAQLVELMGQLARSQRVAAVGEAVPRDRLLADPEYPAQFDPHVWMDPELWRIVVGAVQGALAEARAPAADAFAARAAAHDAELVALAAYARDVLATVPADQRILVSAHDAFGYFGRAYGFAVEGIQGISTESEAGLARIAELVDLLVERRVGAVFVESSVSDRNIRALIEGAASRGHTVRIGAELFSDAMGADGSYEGTYIGMIDHNVTAIARALGGAAPARGLNGRLAAVI